ncbi:MAG: hypothetical protein QM679_03830 [Patulibacter sp.]
MADEPQLPPPAPAILVRVQAHGPDAERAIAAVAAGGALRREHDSPLERPAAGGECAGGAAALDELVRAAAGSLDDADLHLTARRQ